MSNVERKPILDAREEAAIVQARQQYADQQDDGTLRLAKKNNGCRTSIVKSLQKLIMVFAIEFITNPEIAKWYNFMKQKSGEAVEQDYIKVYQKLCVHLVPGLLEVRVMFCNPEFTDFWSCYVQPLVEKVGATSIDLATLMAKTITKKDNSGNFEFTDYSGASVKKLGEDTVREFRELDKQFKQLLDGKKKPPSGDQWNDVLEDFRNVLYSKAKANRGSDVSDKVVGGDDENEENFHRDENEETGIDRDSPPRSESSQDTSRTPSPQQAKAPAAWMPGGSHAWLTFVFFGTFGRARFSATPLRCLTNNTAKENDQSRVSREEVKNSVLQSSRQYSGLYHMDKIVEMIAARTSRESRQTERRDALLDFHLKIKECDSAMAEVRSAFATGLADKDKAMEEIEIWKSKKQELMEARDAYERAYAEIEKSNTQISTISVTSVTPSLASKTDRINQVDEMTPNSKGTGKRARMDKA